MMKKGSINSGGPILLPFQQNASASPFDFLADNTGSLRPLVSNTYLNLDLITDMLSVFQ